MLFIRSTGHILFLHARLGKFFIFSLLLINKDCIELTHLSQCTLHYKSHISWYWCRGSRVRNFEGVRTFLFPISVGEGSPFSSWQWQNLLLKCFSSVFPESIYFSLSSATMLDHPNMHFKKFRWCNNLVNILPTSSLAPGKSTLHTEARLIFLT